ncbi:MAG: hypothetical protein ACOZCO_15835 [Bacteroidota bacterium]
MDLYKISMVAENQYSYKVKKGAADPFRGDWYTDEKIVHLKEEAVELAAELTLANYHEFLSGWEEFGYEWSVFEIKNGEEKKIWEGYAFIQKSFTYNNQNPDKNNGWL